MNLKSIIKKFINKINNSSKKLIHIYYISILISFILTIVLSIDTVKSTKHFHSFNKGTLVDLSTGWIDRSGKEMNITPLTSNNGIKKGKTYTIYHKLPKSTQIGDTLCFRALSTKLNVYVDNKKILCTPYKYNIISCKSPGDVWYFFTFTEKYIGRELKIEYTPCYNDTSCYIDDIYIGNSNTYIINYISTIFIPVLTAILGLFLGIVYIIIDIFICIKQKLRKHTLLYIGLFSIFFSSWSIMASHIIDFIPGMSQPVQFFACVILYIIPIPALLFTQNSLETNTKTLTHITISLTLLLFFVALVLHIANVADLHETLILSHTNILINCITVLISFISAYKLSKQKQLTKKKSFNSNALTISMFGLVIVCFIGDLYVFYSTSSSNMGMFTRISLLFFIIYLGILSFINIYHVDKNATHAKFVQKLAYTDGLTGVGNRTSFQERITYIENNIEKYKSIGILTFDVNSLKHVNDSLGHVQGDDLIISTANIIKQSFGEFGTIYRTGGDEFTVIIEKNNAEAIYKVCAIQFNVNIQNFNNFYNKPYVLSIASGSAFYNASSKLSIYDVIKQSDKDMYKNKEQMKKNEKQIIK